VRTEEMVGGRERVTNTEGASTARGLKRDKAVEIARCQLNQLAPGTAVPL